MEEDIELNAQREYNKSLERSLKIEQELFAIRKKHGKTLTDTMLRAELKQLNYNKELVDTIVEQNSKIKDQEELYDSIKKRSKDITNVRKTLAGYEIKSRIKEIRLAKKDQKLQKENVKLNLRELKVNKQTLAIAKKQLGADVLKATTIRKNDSKKVKQAKKYALREVLTEKFSGRQADLLREAHTKQGLLGGTGVLAAAGLGKLGKGGGILSAALGKGAGIQGGISSFMNLSKVLGSVGKGAGAAGGMLSTMVGAFKLLGLAIKGIPLMGWIMMLVEVGKKLVELNNWLKDLNTQFMKMAGPTVGLGNVSKSMEKFNSALFDVQRNIRLGIDSKDIQKMFGAMSAQGLSMPGILKHIGDYGEAIEKARKLGIEFGVDFEKAGGMMADQMMNLRSSIMNVEDAFQAMSYDAMKAGIESNKFYQSVESATTALSFYGNFLKNASGLLRDFTKTGAMGFKDASEATTEIMSLYKDPKENRKFIVFLESFKKGITKSMFGGLKERYENELKKIEDTITEVEAKRASGAMAPEKAKEMISALEEKKKARRLDIRMLEKTLGVDIGTVKGLQLFSEALASLPANEVLTEITGRLVDMFGSLDAVPQEILEWIKVNGKLKMEIGKQVEGVKLASKDYADSYNTIISTIDDTKVLDDFKNKLAGIAKTAKESGMEKAQAQWDDLKKSLIGKIDTKTLDQFEKLLAQVPEYAEALAKGGPLDPKEFEKLMIKMAIGKAPLEDQAKITDEQTKAMIKLTTPIQKYLGITKEGLDYVLARGTEGLMNIIASATSTTAEKAGGILNWLINWKRGKSEEGKALTKVESLEKARAQAASYAHGYGVEGLSGEEKDYAKYREQIIASSNLEQAIGDLNNQISKTSDPAEIKSLTQKRMRYEASLKRLQQYKTDYLGGKSPEFVEALDQQMQKILQQNKATDNNTKAIDDNAEAAAKLTEAIDRSYIEEKAKQIGEELKSFKQPGSKESVKAFLTRTDQSGDITPEQAKGRDILLRMLKGSEKDLETLISSGRGYEIGQNLEINKDAKVLKSGLFFGTQGDVLIPKKDLATVLGSNTMGAMSGQFMREAGYNPGMIKGGSPVANNWGGITITVSGNVNDKTVNSLVPQIKKAFEDAVDQRIRKHSMV